MRFTNLSFILLFFPQVVDPEASKQTESRLASLGSVVGLDLQTPPDLLSEGKDQL